MDCNFLENSLKNYFERLSAKIPIPGGGSAVACVASLSSSLLNMVINYTIGKKTYKIYEEEIKCIKEKNEKILENCMKFIEYDSVIYERIDKAIKNKINPEDGLKESVFLHLKICEYMLEIVKFCEILTEKGNKNLISDTGISNIFAYSAFLGAKMNIFINLKFLNDLDFKNKVRENLEKIEREIKEKSENITKKIIKEMEG